MDNNLISIIIPVFNEQRTIESLINKIKNVNFQIPVELIVIDDCSNDSTYHKLKLLALKHENLKLFRHDSNFGKGRCIKEGYSYAKGMIAIIQDADEELDPEEIPKIIDPIIKNQCKVVYGSRFLLRNSGSNLWHILGNKFLTAFSNILNGQNLTDMETCYKALHESIYKNLNLKSDRFAIEPEITAKIARLKHKIVEVPISYKSRSYKEGKKIGIKDGFSTLFAIIRYSIFRW